MMKKVLAAVVVVAVVAAAAVLVAPRYLTKQTAVAQTEYAQVRRGTVTSSIESSGNLEAVSTSDMTFGIAGEVKAVYVELGDVVAEGDILMELDTTDLELDVTKAQLAVASAESALEEAKEGATAAELAAAQAAVKSAEENLLDVQAGPSEAEIAAARANLAAAQAKYAELLAGPTDEEILSAESSLQKAELALQQAQVEYAEVADDPDEAASALAAYQEAQMAYEVAKASYDSVYESASASDLSSAAASVQTAQNTLDSLLEGASEAELATAQAQLDTAKAELEDLMAKPTDQDIAEAEYNLELAQIELAAAQSALEDAKLVAPFDGIVTYVAYKVGEYVVSESTAVSLVDLSQLELEAPVAEVDIASVAVGQAATVELDALPGVVLNGTVTYVGVVASASSGVVNYPVVVSIVDANPQAKVGMTATVTIVTERHDDVLMVPERALIQQGPQTVVNVLRNGQVVPTVVTTGLTSGSWVEVSGDLAEGDTVELTGVSALASGEEEVEMRMGGMMGGAMMGGGGMPSGGVPGGGGMR